MFAVIHPKRYIPQPPFPSHTHTQCKQREADKRNRDKNIYNVKIPKVPKSPAASIIQAKDFPTVSLTHTHTYTHIHTYTFFCTPPFWANQKQTNLFWT